MKLLFKTGKPRIDTILQGMVNLFEKTFPHRIRSYYLVGSYAEGTETRGSDLDGCIVFREAATPLEREKAREISESCNQICEFELDFVVYDEFTLSRFGSISLKFGSRLIHGDDIREMIPLLGMAAHARFCMHQTFRFLSRVRQNADCLRYPLAYPRATDEFYGYADRTIKLADSTEVRGTKELTNCVGKPAFGILAWQGSVYVRNKEEFLAKYREVIKDEWTSYIEEVFMRCRDEWAYKVPEVKEDKDILAGLCEKAIHYENHFLEKYKEFLAQDLTASESFDINLTEEEACQIFGLKEGLIDMCPGIRRFSEMGRKMFNIPDAGRLMALDGAGKVVYPDSSLVDLLPEVLRMGCPEIRNLLEFKSESMIAAYVKRK